MLVEDVHKQWTSVMLSSHLVQCNKEITDETAPLKPVCSRPYGKDAQ